MGKISNTLCNACPWEVKVEWHQGICLTIEPDGHLDLMGQLGVEQLDDFREGKPGSEAVQELMKHWGIFLRDHSRTYESQALDAMRSAVRSREVMYNEFINNMRKGRAREGISENPEAFEELVRQSGYAKVRTEIDTLKNRIKFLEKEIGDTPAIVREQLDPERTLMFTDPPRIFPTKLALQMFLHDSGNEKVKRQYDAYMANYRKAESGNE